MTRVVGRRTALRYLAVGVGASLLAACGKGTGDGGGPGAGAAAPGAGNTGAGNNGPGNTGSGGTGSGPVTKAFAAFVTGTWNVVVEPTGNGTATTLTADITASSWSLTLAGRQSAPWGGQWALMGRTLAIHGPENPEDLDELVRVAALNVPARVGPRESLVLPWQPPGGSSADTGQNLEVEYAKGTLRIAHVEGDSRTVYTCTRG
ncbi:hypothetical protein ACF068_05560 [Streptomyces sp. NPDC016309]|uniref:hypothetical protein n=1 Tax=Streptomyces sp. NPDC016309 TaxID=3364965 RepID=UPI003702C7BB